MNGVSKGVSIIVTVTLVLILALLTLELTQVIPRLDKVGEISTPPQKTITVTGEGRVSAEPDLARMILGVETRAEEAGEAILENNRIMEAVRAALADLGIADEDIQTVEFGVHPRFSRQEGEDRIVGYRASNLILVKIRGVDRVGEVLNAATTAGANNIGTIIFTIEDPSSLQAQAREKAIADARSKAEESAQAAGVGLGDLLSLSEFMGFLPQFQLLGLLPAAPPPPELPSEIPIAGGVLEIVVQVSATYLIQE